MSACAVCVCMCGCLGETLLHRPSKPKMSKICRLSACRIDCSGVYIQCLDNIGVVNIYAY